MDLSKLRLFLVCYVKSHETENMKPSLFEYEQPDLVEWWIMQHTVNTSSPRSKIRGQEHKIAQLFLAINVTKIR